MDVLHVMLTNAQVKTYFYLPWLSYLVDPRSTGSTVGIRTDSVIGPWLWHSLGQVGLQLITSTLRIEHARIQDATFRRKRVRVASLNTPTNTDGHSPPSHVAQNTRRVATDSHCTGQIPYKHILPPWYRVEVERVAHFFLKGIVYF